jgi:hypothetical protein
MSGNQEAYQALGEAILEQLVVRAGILQGQTPAVRALQVALNFEIASDANGESIVISCERVGSAPLELQLQLPS